MSGFNNKIPYMVRTAMISYSFYRMKRTNMDQADSSYPYLAKAVPRLCRITSRKVVRVLIKIRG